MIKERIKNLTEKSKQEEKRRNGQINGKTGRKREGTKERKRKGRNETNMALI